MEDWDELEALILELRAGNEAWSQTADRLREQLSAFDDVAQQIDRAFTALEVLETLAHIGRRLLNGTGQLHHSRTNYGLTRVAALVWRAGEVPLVERHDVPAEALYAVEVRIGPRYLLGGRADAGTGASERVSILIEGEKELLATLPTTRERFRTALLRAVRAPRFAGPTPPVDAAGGEEAAATAGTSETEPASGADKETLGQAEPRAPSDDASTVPEPPAEEDRPA